MGCHIVDKIKKFDGKSAAAIGAYRGCQGQAWQSRARGFVYFFFSFSFSFSFGIFGLHVYCSLKYMLGSKRRDGISPGIRLGGEKRDPLTVARSKRIL